MPNWCTNELSFTGMPPALESVLKDIINNDGEVDFEKILPIPEPVRNTVSGSEPSNARDWYIRSVNPLTSVVKGIPKLTKDEFVKYVDIAMAFARWEDLNYFALLGSDSELEIIKKEIPEADPEAVLDAYHQVIEKERERRIQAAEEYIGKIMGLIDDLKPGQTLSDIPKESLPKVGLPFIRTSESKEVDADAVKWWLYYSNPNTAKVDGVKKLSWDDFCSMKCVLYYTLQINRYEPENEEQKKKWIELAMLYFTNISEYGAPDWYEWCCKNWGTKWNASETSEWNGNIVFNTAWGPPSGWLKTLSEKHPGVMFQDRWYEKGGGCAYYLFLNGKGASVPFTDAEMHEIFGYDEEDEDADPYYGDETEQLNEQVELARTSLMELTEDEEE